VNGGSVSNTDGYLGFNAGSVGTATVSSGTWASSGDLYVGILGTGTLTMNGGLVTVGGTLWKGGNGTINLNAGGTLQIGVGSTGGVLLGGTGNLTNNGTLVFNRSDASTYSGVISGTGAVTKQGTGTLTLSGSSSYTGGTTLNAGSLVADHLHAFGSGAVLVNSGTLNLASHALANAITNLGGTIINAANYGGTQSVAGVVSMTGTVGGTVNVAAAGELKGSGVVFNGLVSLETGAQHSPGNSPGTQTFTSGLSYSAGSILNWELIANSGTGAGTNYDFLSVTGGSLVIESGAILDLVFSGSDSTVSWSNPFWDADRTWTIIDALAATSSTGEFTLGTISNDSLGQSLLSVRPDAAFSVGREGNNAVLTFTAVPEPSTYCMALAGIACGGYLVRRRKRNRLSRSPIIAASLPLVVAIAVTAGLIGGIAREAVGAPMVLVNNGSQILRFDGTTGASLGNVLVDYGGGSISGYTFGPDRNIYVTDFNGLQINRFNGSTGAFMNTFATGTLSSPYQPLFGPDGNLYLGQSTGIITKYNGSTGQYLGIFISPPVGASDFGGMAFRGNSLYVSYLGQSGSLYRYDAATGGNAQLVYGGFFSNGPRAPVFDNAGTMYVPDWQTNKIFKFSETTLALTGTITTAFGIVPMSLAFDESGALLVLSDNFSQSQINRYNPATGAFIDTLVAPGTGGMGRANSMLFIVPEPSTYAMALAGLACGGFSIWRRRKHRRVSRAFLPAASLALVAVCLANGPLLAAPITIDWVTVGNPNNPANWNGYGSVATEYRIAKYEVTIQQYTEFLNAADPHGSNPYGIYDSIMSNESWNRGISFSNAAPSGHKYGPIGTADRPIVFVNWFNAARFANWMHNGQGAGSTETGAYTLGGITSGSAPAVNPGANIYIPTANQWFKAAYYSPVLNSGTGGYFYYATQSNTAPGNIVGNTPNQANYYVGSYPNGTFSVTQTGTYGNENLLTAVGSFTNSASYYGTFDQSGSVVEWNDGTGAAGLNRGLSGGGYSSNDVSQNSMWSNVPPSGDGFIPFRMGFRLAAPVAVPEPSTYAMALAGMACGGYSIWRRRKQACRNSLSMISTRGEQAAITGLCFGRSIHPRLPHNSPHPTRPFRSRMSSTPRLLRSAFICGSFSLILFGSASSQAEIMFSDKFVWGRLSGLSGGSNNGIWDNEPVDQSYGPSASFSEQGAGFFGRGYGIDAFFSGSPTMIYSPFVSGVRPFPEIGTDMQYVYKMGTLNFAAYQHFPGGTWTWEFNGSYTIASDEPMSRVFVTVFGAPTPSAEAVVRDSGELGGAFSNSGSYDLTVQTADILYNGSWQVAEYGIYAVVPIPVPEPSTYAMALAGLACGGFSMWRRLRGAGQTGDVDEERPIRPARTP